MKDIDFGYRDDVVYLVFDMYDYRIHSVPYKSISKPPTFVEVSNNIKEDVVRAILSYRDEAYGKFKGVRASYAVVVLLVES